VAANKRTETSSRALRSQPWGDLQISLQLVLKPVNFQHGCQKLGRGLNEPVFAASPSFPAISSAKLSSISTHFALVDCAKTVARMD
jgi:hypothetical protein